MPSAEVDNWKKYWPLHQTFVNPLGHLGRRLVTFLTVFPFLQVIDSFFGDTAALGVIAVTRMVGLENVKPEALIFNSVELTDTAVVAAFFSPVVDSNTSAMNCDFEFKSLPHKHDAVVRGTVPLYRPSSGVVPSVSKCGFETFNSSPLDELKVGELGDQVLSATTKDGSSAHLL